MPNTNTTRSLSNSVVCLKVYSILKSNTKKYFSVTEILEKSNVSYRANITREGRALFDAGLIEREIRLKEYYYRLCTDYLNNPIGQDLEKSLSVLGKVI